MKLRLCKTDIFVGYEAVAAMTAVLLFDRENIVISCAAAALLHETGHLLMMRLCGVRVNRVRLRLFDVLIEAQDAPTWYADCWITLGGPLINLLCALVLCPFSRKLGWPHVALGVFNLLPLMSLDGGHLLELCLSRRCSVRACNTVLRITTFVFLLPLMTAGIILLFHSGYNYSLLIISLYLMAVLFLKR